MKNYRKHTPKSPLARGDFSRHPKIYITRKLPRAGLDLLSRTNFKVTINPVDRPVLVNPYVDHPKLLTKYLIKLVNGVIPPASAIASG